MRLLRYRDSTGDHFGALVGDQVVDVPAAGAAQGHPLPDDLLAFIEQGASSVEYLRRLIADGDQISQHLRALKAIELLAPLYPPRGNILAVGRNYADHVQESARAWGQEIQRPTIFTKAQTTINGPYADVVVDATITSEADYEGELGVVIGRHAKNIAREDALNHVFGYTVINDVSARDIQNGWGGQFFKGKSLDGFCPVGPWIVTADEVPDPQNLRVLTRVNGVLKQDANTSQMIFPVDEIVSQLSVGMTLLPGSLIATGTPAGVGFARVPPEFLQPGDVVEVEIEGIGLLRNRIVGSER